MGDAKNDDLRVSFDSRLRLKFLGSQITTDAERLAIDPAMGNVVGGGAALDDKYAASTSEVGRFETDILGTKENLTTLMNLSGRWIDTVRERKPLKTLILDMDSSVSETYGS